MGDPIQPTAQGLGQSPGATAKIRILVTDDSKLVRKAATKILEEKFDLVLAADGEEAWDALQRDSSIQVVFTDLGMPNLDGYGLIQRIRQCNLERIRDLPVIVITGAAEEESVKRKVFEIGATDFVGKPFKSTEIIARAEAHACYRSTKEVLQENVDIDLLTGTLNRKKLDEKLEKDVSFINRHQQSLAVIMFELDDFKTIAEGISKAAADKIIQHVAKTLGNAIRREDSFGRYEFAKFLTILPMAKTDGVVQLSKRLCEHVNSSKLNIGGKAISLTLSAGIAALRRGSPATAEDLLQACDQALSNAKKVGRGEVQLTKLEVGEEAKAVVDVSIDGLLEEIANGKKELVANSLDAIVKKLAPLLALLPEKHKRRLLP